MADLPAARKRLGDRLAHYTIDLCARVVADRLHFRRVGLAVRERRFVNGTIENASDDIAVILVHNYSRCRSSKPASGTSSSSFRNSSSAHLPFSKHYTTYTRPFGTIPANKGKLGRTNRHVKPVASIHPFKISRRQDRPPFHREEYINVSLPAHCRTQSCFTERLNTGDVAFSAAAYAIQVVISRMVNAAASCYFDSQNSSHRSN